MCAVPVSISIDEQLRHEKPVDNPAIAWASFKTFFLQKNGKSIKSEKSDFCQIWQLGGSRWVQNTPTSGGNDLPARESPFRENKV